MRPIASPMGRVAHLPSIALTRTRSKTSAPLDPSSFSSMAGAARSEEHTSELQSPCNLVCRLLLEKKKKHRYFLTYLLPTIPVRSTLVSHTLKRHSLNYYQHHASTILAYTPQSMIFRTYIYTIRTT